MKIFLKPLITSTAILASVWVVQANAQPFYFDQRAGLNPGSYVEFDAALTETFSGALGVGYPGGVVSDLSWEFGAGDPGDPSALNITTYSDAGQGDATGLTSPTSGNAANTGDTNLNGEWDSSEWWTITRLTQTNNEINGFGVPLWSVDAIANLEIFSDAAHTNAVLSDFGDVTGFTFNETQNAGPCNPADGTICPDYYLSALADFATVGFSHLGTNYLVDFRVISPDGSATIDFVGDELRVITTETFPGVSMVDVQIHFREVPEPATIALMGLGLVGVGVASRRRANQKKA